MSRTLSRNMLVIFLEYMSLTLYQLTFLNLVLLYYFVNTMNGLVGQMGV